MASWLARVFFGGSKASTGETAAADGAHATRPPQVGALPAAPAANTADAIVGSRRPLLDREGQLAGFEFMLAGPVVQRLRRRGDVTAHAAHAAALLSSMRVSLSGRRTALIALPLAIASRPAVLSQVGAGMMLALTDGPWPDPAQAVALDALRKAGARLGSVGAAFDGGQFVLLDGQTLDSAALAAAAEAVRATGTGLQVVATGLPSIEALEDALEHGVDLAAGNVDRTSSVRAPAVMPPRQERICQMLNQLMREVDLAELAGELRTDVDLSYRLLAHANSPLLGLSRPAESVEQAVMLLGRQGLYRWLTLQLLACAQGRRTSRALQEVALARARLLEALAPPLGAPPASMFTVGMLSLLEVMLQMPMADALRPLQLPAPAMQALLERAGPWFPGLDLAQRLEQSDLDAAEILSTRFGGLDLVNDEAAAAWRWAAEAVSSSG